MTNGKSDLNRDKITAKRLKIIRDVYNVTQEELLEVDGWRDIVGLTSDRGVRKWEAKGIPQKRISKVAKCFHLEPALLISSEEFMPDEKFQKIVESRKDKFDIDIKKINQELLESVVQKELGVGYPLLNDIKNELKKLINPILENLQGQKLLGIDNNITNDKKKVFGQYSKAVDKTKTVSELKISLEFLNKSIKLNGKYEDAYLARGIIYLANNNITNAQKDFRKVIELDQSRGIAHHYLTGTVIDEQTKAAIVLFFNRLMGTDPGNDLIDSEESGISFFDIDAKKNLQSLDQLIEIDKNLLPAYVMRAYIRLFVTYEIPGARKDFEKAVDIGKELFEINNDRIIGYYLKLAVLGNAFLSLFIKRYNDAMNFFDVAIEKMEKREPKIYYYYFRGNTLLKLNRYNEAIKDFSEVIEENKNDGYMRLSFFSRGVTLFKIDQYHDGIRDFRKIIESKKKEFFHLDFLISVILKEEIANALKIITENNEELFEDRSEFKELYELLNEFGLGSV